jgi:5'(3')-deoxyribonucleotidase
VKTVLLDCDGVLADFTGSVLKALNERNGTDFTPEDVTDWDMAHCLGVPNRVIYDIASEAGFCLNLKPLPGAEDALDELNKIADVYCVTSPIHTSPYWMFERTQWLYTYGIVPSHVIQGSAKHLLVGDVFIDDKPRSVQSWVYARNKRLDRTDGDGAFLWAQPYNSPAGCEYEDSKENTIYWRRTGSWQDIIDYVMELK